MKTSCKENLMTFHGKCGPPGTSRGQTPVLEMAGRTRAIVRLEGWNRVVTKGYQKGVYERVTKGIKGKSWVLVGIRPIEVRMRER